MSSTTNAALALLVLAALAGIVALLTTTELPPRQDAQAGPGPTHSGRSVDTAPPRIESQSSRPKTEPSESLSDTPGVTDAPGVTARIQEDGSNAAITAYPVYKDSGYKRVVTKEPSAATEPLTLEELEGIEGLEAIAVAVSESSFIIVPWSEIEGDWKRSVEAIGVKRVEVTLDPDVPGADSSALTFGLVSFQASLYNDVRAHRDASANFFDGQSLYANKVDELEVFTSVRFTLAPGEEREFHLPAADHSIWMIDPEFGVTMESKHFAPEDGTRVVLQVRPSDTVEVTVTDKDGYHPHPNQFVLAAKYQTDDGRYRTHYERNLRFEARDQDRFVVEFPIKSIQSGTSYTLIATFDWGRIEGDLFSGTPPTIAIHED